MLSGAPRAAVPIARAHGRWPRAAPPSPISRRRQPSSGAATTGSRWCGAARSSGAHAAPNRHAIRSSGRTSKALAMSGPFNQARAVLPVPGSWRTLPIAAQVYVGGVILTGAYGLVAIFPRHYPPPVLFIVLVVLAGLTSSWKVNVPISVANGATLSVSYAANLMALLLLGTSHAVLISLAGVWTQCRYRQKQSYPLYKTLFSCAAIVITMIATGRAYVWLGGPIGEFTGPGMARSLVVAIATYFFVNTALIAGAISLSTRQPVIETWHNE